jgi:hypothetical protein
MSIGRLDGHVIDQFAGLSTLAKLGAFNKVKLSKNPFLKAKWLYDAFTRFLQKP